MVDDIPLTTPVQDTNSHTSVDDLHFSSGHTLLSTPLSVLEIETKRTIASFNDTGGLLDTAQQQNSQPENVPHLVSDSLQIIELNIISLHCRVLLLLLYKSLMVKMILVRW